MEQARESKRDYSVVLLMIFNIVVVFLAADACVAWIARNSSNGFVAIAYNGFLHGYYDSRGRTAERRGDYDIAIKYYDKAIKADPKNAATFNNRGGTYHAKGDDNRAIADYGEAIRLNPKFAFAWSNRCWARAIIGQLASALADCNESLRLRPNNANVLDTRGLVHLKSRAIDKAIADYDAALKLEPNKVTSLYGRGLAKRQNGDASAADDIAAATAIKADIAEEFARYGVK